MGRFRGLGPVDPVGKGQPLGDLQPRGDVFDLLEEAALEPLPWAPPPHSAGPPPAHDQAENLVEGARELHELGDFSGSLELVQKALDLVPGHPAALAYLARNEETLLAMYQSRHGPLDTRPRVVLRPDEIVWLNLDAKAGFLLSRIDGASTLEDIYEIGGLGRLDTARILADLVEQGVIAF